MNSGLLFLVSIFTILFVQSSLEDKDIVKAAISLFSIPNKVEEENIVRYDDTYYSNINDQISDLKRIDLRKNISVSFFSNETSSRRLRDGIRKIRGISDMVEKLVKDNRVMVTFADYSYLESFYVCYTVSRLWRFSNFFVVALDKRAYDVLDSQGFPVALIKASFQIDKSADSSSTIGEHNFNQIMRMKMVITRHVLSMGVGCLIFDSDVVIFKDPFSQVPTDNFDLIAQKDETVCAGFMYLRPTTNSIRFVDMTLGRMEGREIHDQDAMREIIEGDSLMPELDWRLFFPRNYSRGNIFFEKHQFCWVPIDDNVVMAHNNYVISYVNKIYRLKESGLYNLDINGEYSSLKAKYLVLERYEDTLSESALETFVALANALNRHMVLPIFPCYVKDREEKECNLCGFQPINCQRTVMVKANLPWKEHVFFNNEHVPLEVKFDYANAPTLVITSSKYDCKEAMDSVTRKKICLVYKNKDDGDLSILKLFDSYKNDRVIRIHTLPSFIYMSP